MGVCRHRGSETTRSRAVSAASLFEGRRFGSKTPAAAGPGGRRKADEIQAQSGRSRKAESCGARPRRVGIDPVHFGLIMIVNQALGMITPPFGVNLFAARSVARSLTGKSTDQQADPETSLSATAIMGFIL
jgi:hypothetical protein